MLEEQRITSFSPDACLYRWKMRQIVDRLFAKRDAIIIKDGKKCRLSRIERKKYDMEARQLWRTVIIDSNKM
jgi:hypothetical protein